LRGGFLKSPLADWFFCPDGLRIAFAMWVKPPAGIGLLQPLQELRIFSQIVPTNLPGRVGQMRIGWRKSIWSILYRTKINSG
jgi:hypothetical protein